MHDITIRFSTEIKTSLYHLRTDLKFLIRSEKKRKRRNEREILICIECVTHFPKQERNSQQILYFNHYTDENSIINILCIKCDLVCRPSAT